MAEGGMTDSTPVAGPSEGSETVQDTRALDATTFNGKFPQRAITGNGAQRQKASTSSVCLPDPPQRANSRNGILWVDSREKARFLAFRSSYGAQRGRGPAPEKNARFCGIGGPNGGSGYGQFETRSRSIGG